MLLRVVVLALGMMGMTAAAYGQCPSAPTSVAAFRAGCSQIVSWSAAASPLTFRVYRSTTNSFATATVIAAPAGTARSYTDTGVMFNTTYYYWVAAVDLPNLQCPLGVSANGGPAVGTAISAIGAPTNLQAVNTCQSLTATWGASPGATSYRVVVEMTTGNVVADTTTTGTSITLAVPTPVFPLVRVTVTPRNACGNGTAASVSIDGATAGYAPTSVSVESGHTCYIVVRWTPDPRHFHRYLVERQNTSSPGDPSAWFSSPIGSTSYVDAAVPDSSLYQYIVHAVDPCGGDPSAAAAELAFANPAPPSEGIGSAVVRTGEPTGLGQPAWGTPQDSEHTVQWRKGVNTDGSGGGVIVNGAHFQIDPNSPYTLAIQSAVPDDNDLYALDIIRPCGVQTHVGSIIVANLCTADVDRNGQLALQDVFAFLNAWFAGCP